MKSDDRASKAEFVWLMLEVARLDRETYRRIRADGWEKAAISKFFDGKSEMPN
jgi:hypothetical protein